MKKAKRRKQRRAKPEITISPASNGGYTVSTYNRVDDIAPLVFMSIEEVLEHLLLTYAEEN